MKMASSPLGVLIQAGGPGRRLGAMGAGRPKALVPFAGATLLDHQLRLAEALGPARICVLAHVEAHAVARAVGGRAQVLVEPEPLGTAGGLALLPHQPDLWLVMNVDHVSNVDLGSFVRAGQAAVAAGDAGLALIVTRELLVDEGVVELAGGHVVGWRERPVLQLPVTTGLYVLQRQEIARALPAPRRCDMPELIVDLAPRIAASHHAGTWIDAGTPERFAAAEAFVLAERRAA